MKSLKVLIADDHQMFREGLDSLIRHKISYISKIKEAKNGEEVLSLLAKEKFDIIFMDIHMPVMNGIEATRQVRKLYPDVKIIAVTMMADQKSIVNMFKAGVSGYILKNTSFKEIEEAIKQVMNGVQYYNKDISDILLEKTLKSGEIPKRGPYKEDLSAREREIVVLICQSFTSREIGEMLHVSEKTIESHRTNIYSKLKIDNIVDLVYYALDNGIVTRNEA